MTNDSFDFDGEKRSGTAGGDGDFCLMMELLKGSSLATELKERGALSAGWGCLAYSLMSIAAFPVVCSGFVPLALRKPVWHLYTDNSVVQYAGIATIAVSMFMSFWILKRSAKETDAATADRTN